MIKSIQNFFKGMIIGIANIIPGVSGGTLALILNIYEPLIEGIHNISWDTVVKFVITSYSIHYTKLYEPLVIINLLLGSPMNGLIT